MIENIKIGLLGVIAVCMVILVMNDLNDSGADKNYTPSGTTSNTPSNTTLTPGPPPPQVSPTSPPPGAVTQAPSKPSTTASYSTLTHDAGPVSAGSKVKHTFEVTNVGSNPLYFEKVSGDQGMTILSYPVTPVEPGKKGSIDVEFNTAGMTGPQSPKVHIDTNTEPKHQHLTVSTMIN